MGAEAMADLFKEQWATVYYDGIGPLRATNFTYTGGGQDVARYKPHRTNGQFGEDQGRQPMACSGEFLFFRDLVAGDADLYPNRLIQVNQARSKPGNRDFNTPDKGTYPGRFTEWSENYDAKERNGCRVKWAFEEFADDEQAAGLGALEPMTQAREQAGRADAGLQLLGVAPAGPTITLQVEAVQGLLDNVLTFKGTIDGKIAQFQARMDAVLRLKELADQANYEVFSAVLLVKSQVQRAAEIARSNAPELIPYVLRSGNQGPLSLALSVYNDRDRAQEIAANNPMRYFTYGQGQTVWVANR